MLSYANAAQTGGVFFAPNYIKLFLLKGYVP